MLRGESDNNCPTLTYICIWNFSFLDCFQDPSLQPVALEGFCFKRVQELLIQVEKQKKKKNKFFCLLKVEVIIKKSYNSPKISFLKGVFFSTSRIIFPFPSPLVHLVHPFLFQVVQCIPLSLSPGGRMSVAANWCYENRYM